MWASLVYFRLLLTKLWGIMCFSLVSMLDFMGQNLTPLKSRLSKLQSWHQNFSCLVGPNEHFYTRCLLSARTSHGTTFAPRLKSKKAFRGANVQTSCISFSLSQNSLSDKQTNCTVNTPKSPPWACDKGCAEACAERFSALKHLPWRYFCQTTLVPRAPRISEHFFVTQRA